MRKLESQDLQSTFRTVHAKLPNDLRFHTFKPRWILKSQNLLVWTASSQTDIKEGIKNLINDTHLLGSPTAVDTYLELTSIWNAI